jgi:hypothetical protein
MRILISFSGAFYIKTIFCESEKNTIVFKWLFSHMRSQKEVFSEKKSLLILMISFFTVAHNLSRLGCQRKFFPSQPYFTDEVSPLYNQYIYSTVIKVGVRFFEEEYRCLWYNLAFCKLGKGEVNLSPCTN